jgi:hypothetical protein
MKKYIPIAGLVLGLNIICVAAETPQETPIAAAQENAVAEKNCKIMLSESIAQSLLIRTKEYLTDEKRKLYFEPVLKNLQEKGYIIAPPLTTENGFTLAQSGSIRFSKKFAACDAKKTTESAESALYSASAELVLWEGEKTKILVKGEGSNALSCEEMLRAEATVAKRLDDKEHAELKSRSDALLAAVKELPECK